MVNSVTKKTPLSDALGFAGLFLVEPRRPQANGGSTNSARRKSLGLASGVAFDFLGSQQQFLRISETNLAEEGRCSQISFIFDFH